MEEVLVRYLHFIGIMVLTATLLAEHLLLASEMTTQRLRHVALIDGLFGLSAVVVLLTGLSLWFWVGKPAEFYSTNPVFHAKLGLFVLMALLSIYPTVFLLKNRKTNQPYVRVPTVVLMLVRLELGVLISIPLLATLMARGYGL